MEGDAPGKLQWMYEGSQSRVNREEYLLGKKVDRGLEQQLSGQSDEKPVSVHKIEHDILPGSVARRDIGDMQIDLARKIQEDPLFQIRKAEDKTWQELMDNPLKRRQFEKLNKLEWQNKSSSDEDEEKPRRKSKKANKSKLDDLDRKLLQKMSALIGTNSGTEQSSSSDDDAVKRRKKTKKKDSKPSKKNKNKGKKERKRRETSSSSSSDEEQRGKSSRSDIRHHRRPDPESRPRPEHRDSTAEGYRRGSSRPEHRDSTTEGYRRGSSRPEHRDSTTEGYRRGSSRPEHRDSTTEGYRRGSSRPEHRDSTTEGYRRHHRERDDVISSRNSDTRSSPCPAARSSRRSPGPAARSSRDDDMERKRRAMMDNARWQEQRRTENLSRHISEKVREENEERSKDKEAKFIAAEWRRAAETGTVESRVKSNRHHIQRTTDAMQHHFARR